MSCCCKVSKLRVGFAGPASLCQQVCFVKVTRVESDLLIQSSKSVPSEDMPPDPQDQPREALGTNQPLTSADHASGSGTDDELESEQTSERSCVVKSSPPEHPPPGQGEENLTAANPTGSAVTTERSEPAEHSGAPSSDMPFLTPEVTEDPEGRKSPNLSSEMPFLTLAVGSSENNTLLNPNPLGKSSSSHNVSGETSVCFKATCPDWCSSPIQEDASQALGSDPDTHPELHGRKDIANHLKASTELFRCSFAQDFPLSANANTVSSSDSPSTSYHQNPPDILTSPLDETDFTSHALPNLFEEPSTIWKNFGYQNPDASELAVPYSMWEEPRCQQVKCPDPSEFPEKSLSFTDLEPSAVRRTAAELLDSPDKSPRSDSSSESGEENSASEAEYGDPGAEPGEIRIVSTQTPDTKRARLDHENHLLSSLTFSQYTIPGIKRKTTKSWRHPLRKPTARAVPSAVKQQANSDDGM